MKRKARLIDLKRLELRKEKLVKKAPKILKSKKLVPILQKHRGGRGTETFVNAKRKRKKSRGLRKVEQARKRVNQVKDAIRRLVGPARSAIRWPAQHYFCHAND
jgi:hypothetical protein